MPGRRDQADLGEPLWWTQSTRCRARERDAGAPKGLRGHRDALPGLCPPARCPGCPLMEPPAVARSQPAAREAPGVVSHRLQMLSPCSGTLPALSPAPALQAKAGKPRSSSTFAGVWVPPCAGYELLQRQGTGLSPSASTPAGSPWQPEQWDGGRGRHRPHILTSAALWGVLPSPCAAGGFSALRQAGRCGVLPGGLRWPRAGHCCTLADEGFGSPEPHCPGQLPLSCR